jgi:hypothetical protein
LASFINQLPGGLADAIPVGVTTQKGQAYADYLKALATSATDRRSTSAIAMAADAKTRVCIYGSSMVIKQLSAFEQVGAKIESDESRRTVARLLVAMREDMGVSGKRVDEADLHLILFGPSQPEH